MTGPAAQGGTPAPHHGVRLERTGRLARVTLDRPHRRNSVDLAMLARLEDVLHELGRDRDVEVVVLTGGGPAFCAGTDLDELSGLSATTTMGVQRRTAELVERWYRLDQTTVTAFNGPAIGSGAVLGLAADLRVATTGTFFRFPEIGFGIPLTWSGVAILSDLVGADRAKRWLLLEEEIGPQQLLDHGLVTATVAPGGLATATDRLIDRLLGVPHVGRSMTKRAARLAGPRFEASANDSYLGALGVALRPGGDGGGARP